MVFEDEEEERMTGDIRYGGWAETVG